VSRWRIRVVSVTAPVSWYPPRACVKWWTARSWSACLTDDRGGALARLGDRRRGHDGFAARVPGGEVSHGHGKAGDLSGGGRHVAAAQGDHAENAARDGGESVCPTGLGDGESGLAIGGGVREPAVRQVDARPQDGQRRFGRDAAHGLAVHGPEDALRLREVAQVDEARRQGEHRLGMAGIGRDPAAMTDRVAQPPERFADPAPVPGRGRTGDVGRDDRMARVLVLGSQNGACDRIAEFVAQPGQGL
jgi:hypothetical protein